MPSPRGRLGVAVWARAAIVGVVVYVAVDVVLVFLRPQFSVLHNAESDYGSRGSYAWLMDANFLLRCFLSLAVVRALWLVVGRHGRFRLGLTLLVVWAVASGLLAFFPDDPVGTRTHGLAKVHLLLAAIAFAAVVVGTIVTTRALRRALAWRGVARLLGVVAWGALVPVVLLGHAHLRPRTLGGLWEKAFLGIELAWFLIVAAALLAGSGAWGDAPM